MLGESKLFPRQVSLGEDLCYGMVSHQFVGLADGTLKLQRTAVSALCSSFQSRTGALRGFVLLGSPGSFRNSWEGWFSSAAECLDTVKSLACARVIRAPRVSA